MAHTPPIILRLTHTGVNPTVLLLADLYDGTDGIFFKSGPPYVPVNGTVDLTMTDDVTYSFRSGTIDGMIDAGWLTYEFIVSSEFIGSLEGFKAGTAVFAAGVSQVAITFTEAYAVPYSAVVSTVDTGNGGNYNAWISNKTSTGFTINISAAPVVGTSVSVAWIASLDNS